jgi:GNAT superfamily N-acetyltransferase
MKPRLLSRGESLIPQTGSTELKIKRAQSIISNSDNITCTIIGYCGTYAFLTYFTDIANNNAIIELHATRKELRLKGYGSQLLRYAIDNFLQRQLSNIGMSIGSDNPARDFYKKIGFEFPEKSESILYGILDKNKYKQYCEEIGHIPSSDKIIN